MATLVLTLDLDPVRSDEARQHVRADVIPWVRRLPGFCGGRWVHSTDQSYCLVLAEFATDAEARHVVEIAQAQPVNPARSWNFDRAVVVGEAGLVDSPPGFRRPGAG